MVRLAIAELPFWEVLIIYILPITIAVLLILRILDILLNLDLKVKFDIEMFADFLVYVIFLSATLVIIYHLVSETDDIFTVLIEDLLPTTWYIILVYGIIMCLTNLLKGANK